MKELEEKILKEGHALSENILKVDSFINHQVDPVLMQQIGDAFAGHFGNKGITKVVTIESSGIAPALMTAISLNVPMIILKKQPSKVLNDNLLQTAVTSFTKGTSYELTLSHQFIEENDNVLIIDGIPLALKYDITAPSKKQALFSPFLKNLQEGSPRSGGRQGSMACVCRFCVTSCVLPHSRLPHGRPSRLWGLRGIWRCWWSRISGTAAVLDPGGYLLQCVWFLLTLTLWFTSIQVS